MTDILIIVSLLGSVWLLAIFFMRGANPKTGAFEYVPTKEAMNRYANMLNRKAYDPSEDVHKQMSGEAESYFD